MNIILSTVLCKNCGLMRSDPYLPPEALGSFYKNEYRTIYDKNAFSTTVPLVRMTSNGEKIYRLFDKLGVPIPKHVYEIGCGTGGSLIPFLLRNHIVIGCDYGVEFIEIGRKLGLDLREGGLETFGKELPQSLVILCHVLEHFYNPLSELDTLRNILPEKSLVYIEVPGIFHIRESYRDPLLFLQYAHAYHFCLQTLDFLMSLKGFERIFGNEKIQAIYRLNPKDSHSKPDTELYSKILRYLKYANRFRWFPSNLIYRLARRLLGANFLEWSNTNFLK